MSQVYRIIFFLVLAVSFIQCQKDENSSPSITSFTPLSGGEGTHVIIIGTHFSSVPGENAVSFNGVPAKVISATSASIQAEVPVGATTGPISITSKGQSFTSSKSFEVTKWTMKASYPGTITQDQVGLYNR